MIPDILVFIRQKISYALFAAATLTHFTTAAQTGNVVLYHVPPAVQTASLGKFVEVPVGHYSGIPNISIPLYELTVKDVTLPISLSYHASGIKVRDIAGPAGLGWTLNAGGMITRIVRGYPDDHDPYKEGMADADDYYNSQYKARIGTNIGGFESNFTLPERIDMIFSTPGIDAERKQVNPSPYSRIDMEQDLFYFNFMGYTGQFTFTNKGVPMTLSGSDLKMEYDNRKFKFTDTRGVQYFFDSTETALDESANMHFISGGRLYNTSWYLSKIYLPDHQQTITFSYKKYYNHELYDENALWSAPLWILTNVLKHQDLTRADYAYGNNPNCMPFTPKYTNDKPHFYSTALFLHEINWNNNKIKFYGDTTRADMYRYRYDSIVVTAGSQRIRKVGFSYDYFNSASSSKLLKRLKLQEVAVNDQTHRFTYIESVHGVTLPPIGAVGEDLWGFYNAEDENVQIGNDSSPLSNDQYQPNFKIYKNFSPQQLYGLNFPNSTYKNSDATYGQIGTLSAITYPTGGKTTFEYEDNTYSAFSFTRDSTIEQDRYTQLVLDSVYMKYCRAIFMISGPTAPEPVAIRNFVVHKAQQVKLWGDLGINVGVTFTEYQTHLRNPYPFDPPKATARLERYNDSTGAFEVLKTYTVSPVDTIGNPFDEYSYNQLKYKANPDFSVQLYLPEGKYRIYCNAPKRGLLAEMKVDLLFPYKTNGIYTAGGLRVKKITFTDPVDTSASFAKSYTYHSAKRSNGVLETPFSNISQSYYYGEEHTITIGNNLEGHKQDICGFINLSINPLIPLGNAQGGVIGYAEVTETSADSSQITYYYTNGRDNQSLYADQHVQSLTLPTRTRVSEDNAWKRGLLKQVDYRNNKQQLVKQDFFQYLLDDNLSDELSVSLILDDIRLTFPNMQYSTRPYYALRTSRHALKSADSSIVYTPAGNFTTNTTYEYNRSYSHTYPIKTTTRNAEGDYLLTHYRYPPDFTIAAGTATPAALAVRNLQDKHVVAALIEKYTQRQEADNSNIRTISAQYIRYKPAQPFADTVFSLDATTGLTNFTPTAISATSVNTDKRYVPALNFDSYDTFGNITQQHNTYDAPQAIIWGYDHQYPVAFITGATYATVIRYVDTTVINRPASDQALRTELNKIRTALSGTTAQVSTYTYSPLTGITSVTDASGKTTFYEYDNNRRLKLINNLDGKIEQLIQYRYQQPVTQ
ncbi:hypothetical protein [Chitinophaga nivalis]|uniref:YD repeat-containing protein n=1 Tax=Chitinophaga nivalis TaxID=2991709 RepID=A0ABT3IMF7_9BACT|nr:hypothetical protein [Chitinophaga nivalis]MCW3465170.1 hypothetical protein [Chitinophaga nivalis]MCW3485138.1 hypothetical protein [Chitinophaga nivalis]